MNVLPMIETVLVSAPPVVLASPRRDADDQAGKWKSIEDRIAGWVPADEESDERIDEDGYRLPTRKAAALALQSRLDFVRAVSPARSGRCKTVTAASTLSGGAATEPKR